MTTLSYLIRLGYEIVKDLTNKTLAVFKNHRANKIEVAMLRDVDSTNIAKVFCNCVRMQSSEMKVLFNVYKVDNWIIDAASDIFSKFANENKCVDYDGLYLEDIGHIGLMISKRNVKDTDIILYNDDTTVYEIALTHQNLFNGGIQRFSMMFTSVDNIKRLN